MVAKETATANTRRDARPRKGAPVPLELSLLDFNHSLTTISAGRLLVTALYPSRSEAGVYHSVTVRDDGSFVICDCRGYTSHGRCFHRDAAEEIAREYKRRLLRAMTNAEIRRMDNEYKRLRPDSLDAAQRIVFDLLCDEVAARYIAAHGRVEAQSVRAS